MPTPSASRLGQLRHSPNGGLYKIVATADSTQNTLFAIECSEPPGGGTPLHNHTREDEFFYVLEGELTLFADGKTITLSPGQSHFAPRNIPHCFKNRAAKPCRFLVFCTPPGVESFFDYGLPLPSGGPPSDEQLVRQIVSLAPQFGIQILGPSPL